MYIRNIETKQMERIKRKNEKNLKRLVSFRYGSCPKHSVTNLSSHNLDNTFKANLVAIAHNYIKTIPDKSQLINTKEIVNTINTIKKNDKIVIAKPDKGSGVVLLDKIFKVGTDQ